jgi:uncharacterized membrane protein
MTVMNSLTKLAGVPNIAMHLSTAQSAVTSGLYIYKDLKNDKFTKNEKVTRVLNSAMTFGISTAVSYGLSAALKKPVSAIAGAYKAGGGAFEKGAAAVAGLAIQQTVSRYLVPVFVAPTSNKLGKKVSEMLDAKDAKKAEKTEKLDAKA